MSTTTPNSSSSSPKKQHIVSNLQPIQLSKSSSLSSPRFPPLPGATTPTGNCIRRIGIGVDLSDESAYAVKWAVENYLRPGDAVILLHVRSTSILYGADWGSSTPTTATSSASSSGAGCNPFSSSSSTSPHKSASSPPPPQQAAGQQSDAMLKEDAESENFTAAKSMSHLAQPLMGARVPFKIHVVKDHDMKERLCLEVERLGLSALVMGSRGIGRNRTTSSNKKGMVGSVSDYCVQHCACPVIVVRYNNNNNVFSNNDNNNNNNNNNNNYYNSNNNHTHTPVENNSNNSGQLELRDEAGDQRN